MLSAGTTSVLESGPREAFLLAHLFRDKDKLQTAMVFAEFPKKESVNSKETPSLSPLPVGHLEWELLQYQLAFNLIAAFSCVARAS